MAKPKTNTKKGKELSTGFLTNFFEQLYMFFQSGVTVWESLSIMSDNSNAKQERAVLNSLYEYTVDGLPLSGAMEKVGGFPDYSIGMCKIGEQTGHMDETILSLKTYYAERDLLSKSIRSAISYPLFMSGMVLSVILILIIQVMPIFQEIFAQLGLGMNPFATFLLNLGQNLNSYSLILLISVCVILVFALILRKTSFGKQFFIDTFDTFPLTKNLSRSQSANRLAFSVSLMMASGIDSLTAFEFSKTLISSKHTQIKIDYIKKSLEDGMSLNNALITSKVFAEDYNGMIVAGTRVGTTDSMLMSISKRYHKETEMRTQKLIGIVEPALVAVLCIMVGLVMLSVMLPLMGILSGMQV